MAAAPTEPTDQPVLVEVGSRCVSEGCYGTVRYVGEVPPAKGEQLSLRNTVWNIIEHSLDQLFLEYSTVYV